MKKYQIIYADPPWPISTFRTNTDGQYGFNVYKTMSVKGICRLPVRDITTNDAVIFIWATNTFLPDAIRVMSDWGFKYHCAITWDKRGGITMRGFHRVTEFLLFGYNGKFPDIGSGSPIKTLVSERRTGHSIKPKLFRDLISRKFSGRKIELFARQKVDGWDCWGNEVESDIEL